MAWYRGDDAVDVLGVRGRDGMDGVDKGARTEHDGDVDEEKCQIDEIEPTMPW